MEIQSIDQLIALWPNNSFRVKPGGREFEGPCPFCPAEPDSTYIEINKRPISFTGTDRFFMRANKTFGCRFCEAAGRGQGRSVAGWYNMRGLSERFGFTIAEDLKNFDYTIITSKPIHSLWFDDEVKTAHLKVHYDFWWNRCRWNKETVDTFQLGYGQLYDWHGPAHLIPMKDVRKPYEQPIEGWYIAARNDHASKPKVKSPGPNAGFFWLIETDSTDKTIAFSEGEKENITHRVLGYKNVAAAFGSTNINKEMLAYLWERGYRHLILTGDNDAAGQKFNQRLGQWATELGYETILYPLWPSSCPSGCDTTNLLRDNEGDPKATRAQFESWLVEFVNVAPPELPVDDDDEDVREAFSRDELRGSGPNSVYGQIKKFREGYDRNRPYGQGLAHVAAAPPGAGKTQAMIRDVEEQAEEYLIQRAEERLRKEHELYDLQQETNKELDPKLREELLKKIQQAQWALESWSVNAVAWYSPLKAQWEGLKHFDIKQHLWFNFEARNESNCANYDIAKTLGENNHNNGRYCETVCPLRDHCREHGYLAQDKKRREYPITVFRHNNIFMTIASDYPRGVVIDENSTKLLEAFLEIKPNELNPFDPNREDHLEDDYTYLLLKDLMMAVRQAMAYNAGAKTADPEHRVSGAGFFRLVANQLRLFGLTLEPLLEAIDAEALEEYHPNFYGIDKKFIKLRCVPDLIRIMQRELQAFTKDNNNEKPSCIHLVAGRLYVFAQERARIPASIPLFILDGTPFPELYEAMFNRKVCIFKPDMINQNCRTIVIGGKDWTKSEFNTQVGRYLQRRKQQAKKIVAKSDPTNPINVDELPHSAEAYQSKMIQEAIQLIVGVSEKHKSLLVVSYKDMKQLLQEIMSVEYPKLKKKLAWEHYGNLRGTNVYENYEAVLLIGAYRIPYDSAYLYISMWANLLGYDEPIESALIKRRQKYHGTDQSADIVSYSSSFAKRYIDFIEKSEAIQAMTRHRPHSSEAEKWIYVAAKRPMARHTTQVTTKIEFMKQFVMTVEKLQKQFIIDQMSENLRLFGSAKKPTFKQVVEKCGGSNSTVKKIFAEIDVSGQFQEETDNA